MKGKSQPDTPKTDWQTDGLSARYCYLWPRGDLSDDRYWCRESGGQFYVRPMPEDLHELRRDSRWPALFPCAMCLVATAVDGQVALEKVVGASIVNRFPYIVALSFCRQELSDRHHPRSTFLAMLERGRCAVVQFLPPGDILDRAMACISDLDETQTTSRIETAGLAIRNAETVKAPVLSDAYLAYEATLVEPGKDLNGIDIFPQPWTDVGSHRVYFLEISAIQLRRDVADGRSQIAWRSLPVWHSLAETGFEQRTLQGEKSTPAYEKGYTPHYLFPSGGTIAYTPDYVKDGMCVKLLPPQSLAEIRTLSDDDARWPCFFPSSLGMISSWTDAGVPNLMPCGSTTVVSRQPLTISICLSYAAINVRYAPRASLDIIRRAGYFGCGVAYIDDAIIGAIKYAGNTSIDDDLMKLVRTGLVFWKGEKAPLLPALPVQFECKVVGEQSLGTHCMLLGEVERIVVRSDVTSENPLEWYPWANIITRDD